MVNFKRRTAMWRTSEGDRVLQGAEWALFRKALGGLWHSTEHSQGNGQFFESGIAAFDSLQAEQKLAMLAVVGKALQDENTAAPELTGHAEATVAAVFEYVRFSIQLEIGGGAEPEARANFWRQLILAACQELDDEGSDLPSPSAIDVETWNELIEYLVDRILWDRDFDMQDSFLDDDPDKLKPRMEFMGIPGNYFVEPAPDPAGGDLSAIRETLQEVTSH